MLSHAYAGFHYDQIKPYWRLERARPMTIWLVLSSAIVFLGVVRIVTAISSPARLDADRAFVIATLVLCAARSRSWRRSPGSASSASRCCRCWSPKWIASRPPRVRMVGLAPGLLLYLALSFLYNTLLLQSADIRL